MDTASAGFHAQAANAGLSTCQACHGANLDGTGGSTTISCARCHGASWRTDCTFCHGGTDSTSGAPPRTTWGRSGEAVRVGAHTAHLSATHGLSGAVTCATCHVVPTEALSPGHADAATATVTFSGLASQGVTASWNRSAATCTTYCHGATLSGGTRTAPVWTDLTGGPRACGACHGAPPPAPHSPSSACGSCHSGYTATTVNLAIHVNGTLDVVPLTCTSCHGKAGQPATAAAPLDAAPPVDAAGASTGIRVGAHPRHLLGGTYANALPCATCHASVASYTMSHLDGVRNVGFTGAASANLQKGTWNPGAGTAAGSCSATWCHGAVISLTGGGAGGTLTRPTWTSSITGCTECHSVSMRSGLDGRHSLSEHRNRTCDTCHGTGYTSTSGVGNGVNRATHVDGVRTIVTRSSGTGIRSYDPATTRCQPSCHGSEMWR
jgi:predicted CxxxxCH...CXXCH cytochrome family protein